MRDIFRMLVKYLNDLYAPSLDQKDLEFYQKLCAELHVPENIRSHLYLEDVEEGLENKSPDNNSSNNNNNSGGDGSLSPRSNSENNDPEKVERWKKAVVSCKLNKNHQALLKIMKKCVGNIEIQQSCIIALAHLVTSIHAPGILLWL